MPRWLVTAVIALVLCCFGFAAAAQSASGMLQHGSAQAQELLAATGAPADAGDETPGHDEQRHDCSEILIGGPGPFVPLAVSQLAPQPPPTLRASPFLEHPKRPPRGQAFTL
ncbi:hypothetical protein AB4Z46_28895 [Variovorax sp. M-6]|uniref:hypothetical protein n=1 Tax=Variovorax sp. M-6 TaxID=3233041 RepID=UPI003F99BD6C